jgi:hypothetical protein
MIAVWFRPVRLRSAAHLVLSGTTTRSLTHSLTHLLAHTRTHPLIHYYCYINRDPLTQLHHHTWQPCPPPHSRPWQRYHCAGATPSLTHSPTEPSASSHHSLPPLTPSLSLHHHHSPSLREASRALHTSSLPRRRRGARAARGASVRVRGTRPRHPTSSKLKFRWSSASHTFAKNSLVCIIVV